MFFRFVTGRDQGPPEKRKGSTTRKKRNDGDGGVICVRYVAFLSRMMDDAKHLNTVRFFFYFFSNLAEMFTIIPVFMHEVVFKKKLLKSHDATAKCTKYMMQSCKQ